MHCFTIYNYKPLQSTCSQNLYNAVILFFFFKTAASYRSVIFVAGIQFNDSTVYILNV